MKYLTKNKTERCVMARIQRQGQRYQANFSVKVFGDWTAANTAAETWINQLIKNLPPPTPPKGVMSSRNSSGVVGVHFQRQTITKRVGRKNKTYHFTSWTSNWPKCVNRGGVKWPVKKFGDDDAFVLAVLCREMETVNRDEVRSRLAEVKGTPIYTQLLNLRKQPV